MKRITLTKWHGIILFCGAIFLLSGAFFSTVWFDESYSLAIIQHDFASLCEIASYDVHPVLYYILLKLFVFPFTDTILAARLFSTLGAFVLALLGYTHIRQDYGARTGFYFTLSSFLFAVLFRYSYEIRMYSWLPVFTTLSAIYAVRCYRNQFQKKSNLICYLLFSLCAAYTQYFGLAVVIGIHGLLLIMTLWKHHKLTPWLLASLFLLLAYLPGAWMLLRQSAIVLEDYWIRIQYPQVFYDSLAFFLVGDVTDHALALSSGMYRFLVGVGIVLWLFILWILFLSLRQKQEHSVVLLLAVLLVAGVIAGALWLSEIKEFYYVRYLMAMYGIVIFALTYALAHNPVPFLSQVICAVLALVMVVRVIPLYETSYASNDRQTEQELSTLIQEHDTILYQEIGLGGPLVVTYPQQKQYFYNRYHWLVQDAYRAYLPTMETIEELSELDALSGRVLVIDKSDSEDTMLTPLLEEWPDAKVLIWYQPLYYLYHDTKMYVSVLELPQ